MNGINSSRKKEEKSFSKKINLFSIKTILIISIFILTCSFFLLHFIAYLKLWISIVISILSVLLSLYIILRLFLKRLEKSGYDEDWHELYGLKLSDLPYYKNDIITNTFKKNGDNYKEELGEINNGHDYPKNKRNYYDLYIPYSSLKNKDKINKIMLFIHGGGWKIGDKQYATFFSSRYAKYGFITATMNHTFLSNKSHECSIFRILDEINFCVADIKEQLNNRGFDESKLELALGGASSGAHLALLYGYSINNCPIPIKFIINIVGPVSMEPQYFYKIKDNNILDNIELIDIEQAMQQNKIENIFKSNESYLVETMNSMIGNRFNSNEIKGMLQNKKININNENYKKLIEFSKYVFPVNYIKNNTVPTLCVYAGILWLV